MKPRFTPGQTPPAGQGSDQTRSADRSEPAGIRSPQPVPGDGRCEDCLTARCASRWYNALSLHLLAVSGVGEWRRQRKTGGVTLSTVSPARSIL